MTGCGSTHALVPGINPDELEFDDELLLLAVVSPELDDEPEPVPPDPPLLGFSTSTCEPQPVCISKPNVASKRLAKTSSAERRGLTNERFMEVPPTLARASIVPPSQREKFEKYRVTLRQIVPIDLKYGHA
jgi:hypothetical protein